MSARTLAQAPDAATRPGREEGRLVVERDGAVARLIIHNPTRRNAVSQDMWRQFEPALESLDADPEVKVLVVRGSGGTFSAGADISQVASILRGDGSGRDGGDLTAAEEALASFSKPTIAAIDGYCVGGGWEIAGACDLRIAAADAFIGITPAKLGIVYPTSGIARLVRLVGPAAAKRLLFTGDLVDAHEALRIGLVEEVAPAGHVHDAAIGLAERIAHRSQLSARAHKALVESVAACSPEVGEVSAHWQREMELGPDARIGIQAFLAKEPPAFEWSVPVQRRRA
jgi:enoyl-CoA hydratase/carnithine racemase